jgi:peptidoglycan/LPS O-acetylase OafA/YrhL
VIAPPPRLPGLDGIRGIAAVGVLLTHLEQSRLVFGLQSFYPAFAERRIGQLSVTLFFVLSGFLITHLLLEEKKTFGGINAFAFYMRRVLRIWPLYYLLTLSSFFIIPQIGIFALPGFPAEISLFYEKLILYLTLSPHLAQSFFPASPVPYGAVLWSVGVEEWFYLFWPWLLLLRSRALVLAIATVLIAPTLCRLTFNAGTPFYFFSQVRFDCMALGAVGAFGVFYRDRPLFRQALGALTSKGIWMLSALAFAAFIVAGTRFGAADDLVYGFLFLVAILNSAIKDRCGSWLNSKPFRFLGAVSYGAYCINWITVVLALKIVQTVAPGDGAVGHSLHFLLGIGVTLGAAALSHRFFEQPFLRLKSQSFSPRASLRRHAPASGLAD